MKKSVLRPYRMPQIREIRLALERGFAASPEYPIIVPPGGSEGTGEEEW